MALVVRNTLRGEKVIRRSPGDWISEGEAVKPGYVIVPLYRKREEAARRQQQRVLDESSTAGIVTVNPPTTTSKQAHEGTSTTDAKADVPVIQQSNPATAPFPIMALPAEVRLEVFGLLVEDIVSVFLRGMNGVPTGMLFPSLAYVSKTVRAEYLMLALEKATFSIHSGPGNAKFQRWLSKIDLSAIASYHTGFDAIKTLQFPYFSRFPHQQFPATTPNNDIELMVKCGNLESISMTWAGDMLIDFNAPTPTGKDVQQLSLEYRLDRLRQLTKLRRVELVRFRQGTLSLAVLENLAQWIRVTLQGNYSGKGVDVKIV
ncbi:hypothetical protein LTR56_014573 [Elasticomyces elasticus]|nr:hypothetical protein LTR56_014573 [Elasticomyces elasticus]KAK4916362.1 hypothetical protein LTR49_015596 [Elasticomyces elasticus]KAK5755834.1 hypothetical protein LTS12_014065 [Elasticomyces elasticus]